MRITAGTKDDLPAIVDILNEAAAHSIASLDTRPISVDDRLDWFSQFGSVGPYRLLVARRGDRVLGYASAQRYRAHEGFRETVEVSIALDPDSRGQGVGTLLYRELFSRLTGEPVHVVLAGIALPNDASVALHKKFGFTEVGVFHEYAMKHGQYISSVWLQRLCQPQAGLPRGTDGAAAADYPTWAGVTAGTDGGAMTGCPGLAAQEWVSADSR